MSGVSLQRSGNWSKIVSVSSSWGAVAAAQYVAFASLYEQVSIYFHYMKFSYDPIGWAIHPIILALCVLVGSFSTGILARVSLVITFVPTLVLAAFQVISIETTLLTVCFQLFLVVFDRDWNYPKMRAAPAGNLQIYMFVAGGITAIFLVQFADLISFSNLLDVYGNRERYVARAASGLLVYAKLVVKVFLVILAVQAYRDIRFGFLAIFVAFLFYTIMSSKFMLFIPIIVWVFPYFMTRSHLITMAFILLFLLNTILSGTEYHLITVSLTRRAFLLVPLLHDIYVSMFQDNGAQYFTTSILSPFADPEMPIARMASIYLWGDSRHNANSGAIGSGVAQLGYIGPFIYASIYIVLANLNPGYQKKDPVSLATLSVFILIALGVSDISTVLIMHGGIVFCLVFRFTSKSIGTSSYDKAPKYKPLLAGR